MPGTSIRKIRLLFSQADKDNILRELMLQGCVEISGPFEPLAASGPASLSDDKNTLDQYLEAHASLLRSIEIIKRYVSEQSSARASGMRISKDRLLDDNETGIRLNLATSLEAFERRISELTAGEQHEKNLIESLDPWASLNLPLDFTGTETTGVILGSVASSVSFEKLQKSLYETVPESHVFLVSTAGKRRLLCIICLRCKLQVLFDALRRWDFSPAGHSGLSGTAEENIKKASARLSELSTEKEDLIAKITAETENITELLLSYDHIGTRIDRIKAAQKLQETEYTFLLTGWVAASSMTSLIPNLTKYDCAWEIDFPAPDEAKTVPIKTKNRFLIFIRKLLGLGCKPFQPLEISTKYMIVRG